MFYAGMPWPAPGECAHGCGGVALAGALALDKVTCTEGVPMLWTEKRLSRASRNFGIPGGLSRSSKPAPRAAPLLCVLQHVLLLARQRALQHPLLLQLLA